MLKVGLTSPIWLRIRPFKVAQALVKWPLGEKCTFLAIVQIPEPSDAPNHMAVSMLLGSRRPPSTDLFLRPNNHQFGKTKIQPFGLGLRALGGSGPARLNAHGPAGRFGGMFLIFGGRTMFGRSCVQVVLSIFL